MTISEAYVAYNIFLQNEGYAEKTRKSYYTTLIGINGLATTVGDIDVEFLGIDHIYQWRQHVRDIGWQAHYINHTLSQFRCFLRWLANNECRVLDWRKITFDREEKHKPQTILEREEIEALVMHAASLRDKALLRLIFDGPGCRISEILGLDRDQWQSARNVADDVWELYVFGKNKKYRPVFFYHHVRVAVDAYLETREDRFKPLFISMQNRRIHYTTVNQMIHAVSRKAGLTKIVTPHVGRHTFATERAALGTPTPIISSMLGHAHEGVTQKVYTHINAIHAARAFDQIRPEHSAKAIDRNKRL